MEEDDEIFEDHIDDIELLTANTEKHEVTHDTEELVEFREKWKAELKEEPQLPPRGSISRAEQLYWMGVSAEQVGDMSSAIFHYRQAIQLVPDIEKKISTTENLDSNRKQWTNKCNESYETETTELDNIAQNLIGLKIGFREPVCTPITKMRATHISALPLEILQCVLCFAVLQDLDLRTLEQFGMVCKGFYILARESFIWKKACRRLWGEDCSPTDYYNNWRLLYISFPHVHFNGIYISQSSYVRNGEQSLDSLYKPFHFVVYYRYLRFYSDGTVVYFNSPQEPPNVVGQMKYNVQREGMMFGHYTQTNNTVTIVVSRTDELSPTKIYGRSRKQRSAAPSDSRSEQFQMEFEITNSKKKLSSQLHWKKFSCQTVQRSSGHLQATDFNIDHTYTVFSFSRVKSYSLIDQQTPL